MARRARCAHARECVAYEDRRPNNTVSQNNLGVAYGSLADALWAAGRLHEAIPYYLKAVDSATRASERGGAEFSIAQQWRARIRQAQTGARVQRAATTAERSAG